VLTASQTNLPRLVELATSCDVELPAVIMLPAGRQHGPTEAPPAPVIDGRLSPIERA